MESNYNQLEIDKLNEKINYTDGKIWWKENYNYTSNVWENCKKSGWKAQVTKNVFVTISDSNGDKILEVNNGWVNALFELSKLMK